MGQRGERERVVRLRGKCKREGKSRERGGGGIKQERKRGGEV